VSATQRAPGLVALAAVWGAVDVAYSIYLLAAEPAGVLRTMAQWLPHAREAILVSSLLGIIIGGTLFAGAFMTHHGARAGLLVLLVATVLYMISGAAYATWGLVAHDEVNTAIYNADQRFGNEINNAIWAFFVGIGSASLVLGGAFLWAIRRAWRRFAEGSMTNDGTSPLATQPPEKARPMHRRAAP
jgi:hypothetical protein